MTDSNVNPYVVQAGELLDLSSQPREYLNLMASRKYVAGKHTHLEVASRIYTATITYDMDNDPLILCGKPIGSASAPKA